MQAYPLQWPAHKRRTRDCDRIFGRFGTKDNSRGWSSTKNITLHQATRRVMEELERCGVLPEHIVISTNLKVRKSDGLPASGQKTPDDPGVAVYFTLVDKQQCVPVDTYTKIEQNMAAVAAVLSALRALERHGSGLMEAAFTGFEALPDPARDEQPHWAVIFDLQPGADYTYSQVEEIYKRYRSKHHPDKGGDETMFRQVQRAWEQFKQDH